MLGSSIFPNVKQYYVTFYMLKRGTDTMQGVEANCGTDVISFRIPVQYFI